MANFFDPGGGGLERRDPLTFFKQSFGAPLNQAIGELLRGIQQARDPEASPFFQQARTAIQRGGAVQNEQLRRTLAGRGTAFSGQGRTAARDIAGSQNRALVSALLQARGQGPQVASQLGGLLGRFAQPDLLTRKPTGPSTFSNIVSGVGAAASVFNALKTPQEPLA